MGDLQTKSTVPPWWTFVSTVGKQDTTVLLATAHCCSALAVAIVSKRRDTVQQPKEDRTERGRVVLQGHD